MIYEENQQFKQKISIIKSNKSLLNTTNHHLFGCHNLFHAETDVDRDMFTEFPWKSTYPLPFSLTCNINLNEFIDPVVKLVKNKLQHQTNLYNYKKRYLNTKKKKEVRRLEKDNIYSFDMKNFIELIEQDPDKYFEGNYNWYYTGGNFNTLETPFVNCLFNVISDGSTLNRINIMYSTSNSNFDVLEEWTPLIEKSDIFEVSSQYSHNSISLSVRQKKSISLLTSKKSELGFELDNTLCSDVPFISGVFDPYDPQFYYTLDVNRYLKRWNIDLSDEYSIICSMQDRNDDKSVDNWGSIQYFDRNLLIHADRNIVSCLDSRINLPQSKIGHNSFKINLDYCEQLTCLQKSKMEHLVYIASNHQLYAFDIRKMKAESKENDFVLRWTHQLRSHPLIMKTYLIDNDTELIHLGTPLIGDSKLCINKSTVKIKPMNEDEINESKCENVYTSYHFPYKPLSIIDSYEMTRSNNVSLDSQIPMLKRINLGCTGFGFVKHDEKICNFTQNSAGDLFIQYITPKNLNSDPVMVCNRIKEMEEKMKEFENSSTLKFTHNVNFRPILRIFRCRQFREPTAKEIEEEPKMSKRYPKWKRPINKLKQYKDVLASDILSIWDVDDLDMSRTDEDTKLGSQEKSENYQNKVESWLDRSDVINTNDIEMIEDGGWEDIENEKLPNLEKNTQKKKVKKKPIAGF